jgi:hypothetical protein
MPLSSLEGGISVHAIWGKKLKKKEDVKNKEGIGRIKRK